MGYYNKDIADAIKLAIVLAFIAYLVQLFWGH